MTSAATAPERHLIRRSRATLALAAGAVALSVAASGGTADAQLVPEPTETVPETTEAPPETTEAPPETTETTEAPVTTAPPSTTAPTSGPPATRAPVTTADEERTTLPPATTTTTAPPNAPSTVPVTTVPVEGRTRITQDTPDLGGVLTLWGFGILGTLATLAWGWWRNQD